MTHRSRTAALAAVALVLAACGGGGGTKLAATGPVELTTPAKDKVTVTHMSLPTPDRLSILGTVENGTGKAKSDLVVAGDVLDATGVKVGQGRGQVITPLTVPKDGIGIVLVTFDAPLPDPFTIEWTERDGDRVQDAVDLRVTTLDLQASGTIRATVENSTGSRVKVVEVDVLCLDAAGAAIGLVALPGSDAKVPKGESVRVDGAVTPGCVSAIAGAVGTKNLVPPTTTTAPPP